VKYIVRSIAGLFVAFVAALLIIPAVIDWNGYRSEIAGAASQILGRPVEIRGNVEFTLLPVPKVTLDKVQIGNVEGASNADMLSLDALEMRIAWSPLMIGNVRAESVKLVRPVLNIEVFNDGTSNLTMRPRESKATTPSSGAAPSNTSPGASSDAPISLPIDGMRVTPKVGGGFDIAVENFIIEDGTVVYRNAAHGIEERLTDLSARAAFASLKGPMDASAHATIRGVPVSFDLSASEIIQGRTAPFNLNATIAPGAVKAHFSGSLNGLDDALRLRGSLTGEGDNLKDFATALGLRNVPDVLRRPFGLQANVAVSAAAAEIADLTLKLDGTQAQGQLTATFDGEPTIDASLSAMHIDLDALLRAPQAAPVKSEPRDKASASAPSRTPPPTALGLPAHTANRISLETLPADLTANLTVDVDAITWRGSAFRQSKLDVSLANREVTVSQLSTLMPGNTDLALFGFVTEKDNLPQFDGTLEATSSDLRGVMDWLGSPVKGIAGDRLRNASLNARLSVRPDLATARELRAKVDATQIDGALTANLSDRPSFDIDLSIDHVNLDAYLPSDEVASPASAAPASSADGAPDTPTASSQTPPADDVLSMLALFGGLDANLRAHIGAATLKGLPFNDVRAEAALANGTLDIKSASIGDLAGVTASVSGVIGGLDASASADAAVRDLVMEAKGKSLANLFRLAEVKSPVPAEALGPVAATIRLNGPVKSLDVASEIQAVGGRSTITGQIDAHEFMPRFDVRAELAYPDAARFVRALGYDWRPRGAKGGIDLAANITGTPLELGMSGLDGSFAGVHVSGSGATRLPFPGSGDKPLVALKLATGDLDLDSFRQLKRTAALHIGDETGRVRRAGFHPAGRTPSSDIIAIAEARGTAKPTSKDKTKDGTKNDPKNGTKNGVWSNELLDLSALTAFDGSFAVKSDSLRFGGLTVANADLDAELRNGLFEIRHLTGKTFGGALTLDGGLQAEANGGHFEARYALADADVGAADRAYGATETSKGRATMDGHLSGGGKSAAEIVASLNGEGSLAFKGIDSSDGKHSMLAAIGGIAQSLERLGGLRGRLEPIPINLSGPYRIEKGIVSFDEFAFTSPIGDGALKGRADLPKWQIAATGEIHLAKDFVIGGGAAKPVPFSLDGALDAPRLKLDIAALPGGAIQIPLDKLTTKKGATEVLKSLIPNRAPKREAPTVESLPPPGAAPNRSSAPSSGQQSDAEADTNAAPKVEPKSDTKKGERVEDILKDILRGVAR